MASLGFQRASVGGIDGTDGAITPPVAGSGGLGRCGVTDQVIESAK